MRISGVLLWLIARIVPAHARARWIEEWRAELPHGPRTMIAGALPDAWALRRLAPGGGRRPSPFHALDQDIRYALRGLIGSPGFILGVVVSLAVGMSATTAAFSLVNSIALRPPAGIQQADDVVQVRLTRVMQGLPYSRSNYESFVALRGTMRSVSGLAAYRESEMTVAFPGEPISVPGMVVSSNYFETLGVRPAAGRLIGTADEGAPGVHPVAVLAHDAWLRHFAGSNSAIGSTIRVNGSLLQIVGVAPPEFTGIRLEIDEDEGPVVWIPMTMSRLAVRDAEGNPASIEQAPQTYLALIGRLAPGVTRRAAQAEAAVLAAARDGDERSNPPTEARVVGLGPEQLVPGIFAFMAVPLIVLALACVNAANLLSGRVSRRIRDAALRLSIGATPWRIVRQMLVESLLLALGGAALGLALTYWIVVTFEYFLPIVLYIDWRVVMFALGTSLVTALAFGLAPGISAAARAGDLVRGMAKRRGTRTRALLIGAQAALSLSLMATGWQFVKTVRTLAQNDGVRAADHLVMASLDVGKLAWPAAEVDAYYDRVRDRVHQLPGVTQAALSCACNPWGAWTSSGGGALKVWLPTHRPDKPGSALAMYSGGDLFGALELPIAAGRAFRPEEHTGLSRAVLVNQPFADRYLAPQALGQTIQIGGTRSTFSDAQTAVVVGVVQPPSVKRTDSMPMIYYPAPVENMPARTLYIRFDRPAADAIPLLHAAIRELHPDVPRPRILTAEQQRWERQKSNQFLAASVSLLGVLALLLAAGGLYGVVAFVVTMRSHEIAVRMALGAQSASVVGMVVRQALTPAAIGAAVGAFGAAAVGLIVRSRLYGASPMDPAAFAGATALLIGVLLMASIVPARRAARIDPITVLRQE